MTGKPRNQGDLTRAQAMNARPVAGDIVARQALPTGGERISIRVRPGKWHRILLRLPEKISREYELDAYGAILVTLCNGRRSVEEIVEQFACEHRLDTHEAERAVVDYLRTLMRRGIVSMALTPG
jgi:hypothetical protein